MGNKLFKEVTGLTGLPTTMISDELGDALKEIGSSPESMTIEDLRKAMMEYLTMIMGEMPPLSDAE